MNVIVILCDTLRRDHCGAYHQGRPLNACGSPEQPDWVVPTPNMDRLAARGTVFDQAWCGSYPTMPARRDLHTGRYEFLERGWGPLEDNDPDLPRQISGPDPRRSLHQILDEGFSVSYLMTDNLNYWSDGGGNYHMGYTGFEFVRGNQEDPWYTDPYAGFFCPPQERHTKLERYFRNIHHYTDPIAEDSCARTFTQAAAWLARNHGYENFFLLIDSFAPHEPWDPPAELVKQFDPRGYAVEEWRSHPPYAPWRDHMTEAQLLHMRARYAAKVVFVDQWLGHFLDTMDHLDLWRNTLVILFSDHGTFNGDHGRMGKNQTHLFDALAHVPFIMVHPTHGHGERRPQLVQIPDVYATVLAAIERPIPPHVHGVNLLPVLEDATAPTREFVLAGFYGHSVTLTDGRWVLHQTPVAGNQPLYWYSFHLSRFFDHTLGPFTDGRRSVQMMPYPTPTWLSDRQEDPSELVNLAAGQPAQLRWMQQALWETLVAIGAPAEQIERLGLAGI